MKPGIPTEVVHLICQNMSGKDIARMACVNTQWRRDTQESHPWLRKALSLTGSTPHPKKGSTTSPELVFDYQQSLSNYDRIEYWSRVCVNTSSDTLRNSIRHQLRLREFLLRPSTTDRSLTREQQRVVDTSPEPGRIMAIQAYAGTGKTTTLYHYAERWRDKKILYLAYNRALTDESRERFKVLPHVHVMTIHSMALHAFAPQDFELSKGIKKSEWITEKNIDDFEEYCSSADMHVPDKVRMLWEQMFETKTIPVTHDAYLKAYQRMCPVLSEYDIIMLDEVQDCTDCVLDIVLRQSHATRIMVGDAYQKIYGFRYVNEAFRYIRDLHPNALLFQLSVSFRMGFTWMSYVNLYLQRMYNATGFSDSKRVEDTEIRFFRKHQFNDPEAVAALPHGTVILCRYNVNLIKLMFLLTPYKRFRVYGKSFKFDKEIRIISDLGHLLDNQPELVHHEKLRRFNTIEEVTEHYQRQNSHTWRTRLRLFHHYGGDALCHLWRSVQQQEPSEGELILTTAHQSKGCEFDHVVLYDDFPMNGSDAHNILYVAMTRAKKRIYLNDSLSHFYKKVVAPNVYTTHVMQTPQQFKTCMFCHRTKTNLLVCKENDHEGILQYNRCDLYEYVPMCNLCKNKCS